jgi:chromosome segregation ATPase
VSKKKKLCVLFLTVPTTTRYLLQAKVVDAKTKEKETAQAVVDRARELHEGLRGQRLSMFMEGFSFINSKLKATYQAINMGGDAEMEPRDHMVNEQKENAEN